MFALPHLPSFRGTSGGPSRVLTFNNQPWMSTQYFKFKLITIESISVIATTFLQAMTPDGQQSIKYDFMLAATRQLPYGRSGDREITMVMKVERVVNIPYVDGFNFANGFDIVHVLVTDLIDENSAKREAKALLYGPIFVILVMFTKT
ncbi:23563_t:CDS:1 [Gigaspora margarita]|uniref:23563_t:CDS:1 n=1 Tax=Gigaspora margarita TaxID=4874 RepID=A0ABM8W0Q2_GIGMA|nr:23563_t:CDS:1 [Gigaspora margarita]